mmetsp:Transcript_15257/g.24782  ORF Transcript_15257/g.24782 Transcript_15257/m.24782 type:complete len:446 (+) Transcript_15257:240-1577(+)
MESDKLVGEKGAGGSYASIPFSDVVAGQGRDDKPNSPQAAFVTTFKAVVGSGFFALPFALMKSGLYGGLLVVGVVWFFTTYTTKQLVGAADRLIQDRMVSGSPALREVGYMDIGHAAYGNSAAVSSFIWVTMVGSQYIAVCAYMVFLQSTLTPLLAVLVYGNHKGHTQLMRDLVLTACCMLQLVLALAPNPAFLGKASNFGNLAFLLTVIFIFTYGFMYFPPDIEKNTTGFESMPGLYICFGIACFTLSAHAEALSIFSTSGDKVKQAYPKIIDCVNALATFFYLGIAVFSYACFGKDTDQIIFANFTEKGGAIGYVLQLCICAMIVCNYPLTLYPIHQMVEMAFKLEDGTNSLTVYQIISRYTLVLISGVIAWGTGGKFGMVSTIGGGFIGLVAFVLPPLFYIRLHGGWSSLSWTEFILNSIIIFIGFYGSTSSLYHGFVGILK